MPNKNKEIDMKKNSNEDTDESSLSSKGKRMEWVVASEVSGRDGFPTSDRWTRNHLKELASNKPHLVRKRRGTKAFEYHVSLLPKETQESLLDGETIPEPQKKHSNNSINAELLSEFAFIPGYSIQVSAGNGTLNMDQLEPSRYLAFRKKWLNYRGFNEKDLVIVWAKGDSMEPTINNNDTLVVHVGRKRPKDGHIYIFRCEDELFVKRYQSVVGTWRLISDNHMYTPLDIKKEEQHQFEVIGQVVHIAKDIGD
ncbi:prophage MuSo2, transcriptional regulator, Cro/CI family protein [Marinomonas sp. MED121]|uniref:S24 family peptidase n=1 Tax=Marinomonas sp. MED121 TaxID=314277 RepID=UPI0000690B85|nr:S24 family peptidase [Marinomonas sp. MED121]EAQ65949.1 prophage MuSo2, transcriptional regulator, Cro/CI family protein [Marinomonas sp. MED121]